MDAGVDARPRGERQWSICAVQSSTSETPRPVFLSTAAVRHGLQHIGGSRCTRSTKGRRLIAGRTLLGDGTLGGRLCLGAQGQSVSLDGGESGDAVVKFQRDSCGDGPLAARLDSAEAQSPETRGPGQEPAFTIIVHIVTSHPTNHTNNADKAAIVLTHPQRDRHPLRMFANPVGGRDNALLC